MFSRFWTVILFLLIGFDQLTKFLAIHLPVSGIKLAPFLDLVLVINPGAAYGLFSGKLFFLSMLTLLVLMYLFFFQNQFRGNILREGATILLFSGALGNGIGRIFRGGVIDFINIHVIPVFNMADLFINISVWLFVIDMIYEEYGRTKSTQNHSG